MRTLWRDVREHRAAAVLLLVGWIALLAADVYINSLWANSIRTPPVGNDLDNISEILGYKNLLLLASPFVAAIVAGWWRATALKSGSWVGPSIVSGVLAVLISSVAFALFEWGFSEAFGPLIAGGGWQAATAPAGNGYDSPGWMIAGVVFFFVFGSVLGALGGIVGGWAARAYWRARGSRGARTPA